jgi:hypothetical protein
VWSIDWEKVQLPEYIWFNTSPNTKLDSIPLLVQKLPAAFGSIKQKKQKKSQIPVLDSLPQPSEISSPLLVPSFPTGNKTKNTIVIDPDQQEDEIGKLEQRKNRFDTQYTSMKKSMQKKQIYTKAYQQRGLDDIDWNEAAIVGTCAELEKPYLRLTTAPDPSTVRPLVILKKTFALLTKKWITEKNYTYICDQFKSLRQDLTVQRIKNEFTVKVYETHSRIAVEMVFACLHRVI